MLLWKILNFRVPQMPFPAESIIILRIIYCIKDIISIDFTIVPIDSSLQKSCGFQFYSF